MLWSQLKMYKENYPKKVLMYTTVQKLGLLSMLKAA